MAKLTHKTHVILKIINNSLIDLPSPSNISLTWNFSSLLGICLCIQILTGIFLSMHYCSDTSMYFLSATHLSHDVLFGWFICSVNANGASLFFMCMYFHIYRGLYYSCFTFNMTSNIEVIIFLITMMRPFLSSNIFLSHYRNHKSPLHSPLY